jgi:DNA polymerase-3 subunit delta
MTYAALRERIRKQKFEPAYFLHGENQFLVDELVQAVSSAIVAQGLESFDRSVFYADEVDAAVMLNALETPPMGSRRRVVILHNVNKLSENGRRALLQYLERPAASSVLVITGPKIDMKRQFYKQLGARTTRVPLSKLRERDIVEWIRERVKSYGRTIDSKGAAMLHNSVGDDQSYLANEIDKLVMCVGERRRITCEDVEAVAGESRANSIFELSDAIGRLDCYRSITLVNNLLAWGQRPTGILAFMLRQMFILLGIKSLQKKEATNQEICRRLNLVPYYLGGYLRQAARFTEAGLRERIELIQLSELRLKSSGAKRNLELESLVYRLCRKDAGENG